MPKSLTDRKQRERGGEKPSRYTSKADKFIGGELTIGDVCRNCNNGPLSELDSYFLQLYDRYIYKFASPEKRIDFTYDFDKLARWLLKVSYNSARATNAPDEVLLESYSKYILGEDVRPKGLNIFLTLVLPYKIKNSEKHDPRIQDVDEIEPDVLRWSRVPDERLAKEGVTFRMVQINSYFFIVIMPNQVTYEARKWYAELKGFRKKYPQFRQLRAKDGVSRTPLKSSGVDMVNNYEIFPSANLSRIFELID
ncbi:hypothetical protein [Halomicronema sp. CCY15110]|uniref:hypothetical protein n=1 Tax=Halomicronema sp. CCY15110 TaxID=2767773 RepID=UPI0019517D70|nr:hypothetical protein [Halomicronema sp. CCY15110]